MRVAAVAFLLLACGAAPDPIDQEWNRPCVVTASCEAGLSCVDTGLGGRRCLLLPPCPELTDPVGSPAYCVPRCGKLLVHDLVLDVSCNYGVPCEPTFHICWL